MDLQSTSKSCFNTDGKPPAGGRKLNSLYSNILPKSTAPLCRSIYSFTQTLLELNLKVPSDAWKQSPSPDNLNSVSSLPDSILLHPINPVDPTTSIGVSEKIPPIYRQIFLKDLDQSKFPGWTFAWEEPWDAQWNQLLSKFILKHWRYAHENGAFKAFHIDPNETSDEIIRTGILHRWFLGRQEGLRLGRFSTKRRGEKKQSEKKSKLRLQLQKHRQDILSKLPLSLAEMELFDNIKCCSETEAESKTTFKRIPLPWRSVEFSALASQLDNLHIHKIINTRGKHFVTLFNLENRRAASTSATSEAAPSNVPRNLPINCYAPEYLATLSQIQIKLLTQKPRIDFSKLLLLTKAPS